MRFAALRLDHRSLARIPALVVGVSHDALTLAKASESEELHEFQAANAQSTDTHASTHSAAVSHFAKVVCLPSHTASFPTTQTSSVGGAVGGAVGATDSGGDSPWTAAATHPNTARRNIVANERSYQV